MQRRTLVALAALAATLSAPAFAQSEIRIAHVYSKTGPLEAYGKQTQTGLMMGLQYATGGTMMVAGKKLVVRQRFVKTGATRGDLIAVTEGLKPGERVATSGLLKLRNDAEVVVNNKVQPVSEAQPKPENR